MLNAGMSLYGVMHLLGHRHVGTTLIYAAITQVRRKLFLS
jgi:site-specific recombinase XerD